jgi:hypothetical protein
MSHLLTPSGKVAGGVFHFDIGISTVANILLTTIGLVNRCNRLV